MKKLFKIFILFIFFFASLIYFFSKDNLYFLLEKELEKNKIVISNEKINFNFIGLSLKDFDIYYDGIKVAKVEELNVDYSFRNFKKILIKSSSKEVGNLNGEFDILNLKFQATFKATSKIKNKYGSLLRQLKRKNGAYLYEYQL